MHRGKGVLSLGDAWQETKLDVGLLKKIVAGKSNSLEEAKRTVIFSVEIRLSNFY